MRHRVFLVRDIQNMRPLATELLAAAGELEIVGSASTEADAKAWLLQHVDDWDLMAVDTVLDQGSGFEVIRFSKERWPRGRIAVFSSYATPRVIAHCFALGADAVFDKTETKPLIAWLTGALHPAGAA